MPKRVIRLNDLASTPDKPGRLPVSPATIWRIILTRSYITLTSLELMSYLGPATTVWDADQVDAFLAKQAGGATK